MSAHRYVHRVRVPEVDNQSYVFNSRYLEIADAAFNEYFRAIGFSLADFERIGYDPSVVSLSVDYLAPARLDDLLTVDTRCVRVGTSSVEMSFVFRRDEREIANINAVYVNVDTVNDRSQPLPDDLRERLRVLIPA